MIDERDQQGVCVGTHLLDSARDRDTHFAIQIVIKRELQARVFPACLQLVSAMSGDDDNLID